MEYIFREDVSHLDLLDGRSIMFLSKELNFNREQLSKVLRGIIPCSRERAEQIVKRCNSNAGVLDYFKKI